MQVEELFGLTNWIQNEIVDTSIPNLYQNLFSLLNANAQPNQTKQPFEQQKDSLVEALITVPLSELSIGQLKVLAEIGIAEQVGQAGADKLEEILFRNSLDIATTIQKINSAIGEISWGIQWAAQVRTNLAKIVHDDEIQEIGNSVLIRVHFQKSANLSNLTDFKDWGKTWWDIGRGIAMAHNASPEDIQVVGASKGSVIISLLAAYGIAKTTSTIILEALKVAEKVIDIKKKIEEIKSLKLSNQIAEQQLQKDLEEQKEEGIKNITSSIVAKLEIKKNGEGDKVEALDSSIKKLVDFVEKGGEVDFVIPDEDASDAETEAKNDVRQSRDELRVIFSEVRSIEAKLKGLEYKNSEK